MDEKWEFMNGEEVVYSSALDILGEKEHRAWGACIPKIGQIMGRWGWETKLKDLSRDRIRELVLTITLEFEKHMKLEQLPEGDAPLFFDVEMKVPLPDNNSPPPPAGLIPTGMEAPRKARTGPVTDADFPWEQSDKEEGAF